MNQGFKHIKTNFITGLVLLLPIVLTVAILNFLINFLTQPFLGIVSKTISHFCSPQSKILFISQQHFVTYLAKALVLIALFSFTILLGLFTRLFFMKSVLSLGDRLLHKIPIVKTVYKTTQDIIKTLFVSDKNSFKQVVMVPFPKDGMYMLGLIVRESPSICSQAVGEELISVLIPTTPNPTTGFLIMVKKQDLTFVDIKPEDAVKYIVSCGVIIPCQKP
jgi:uncharacterized membrane protein